MNIPNVISINPVFVVNLKLSAKSQSQIYLTTGESKNVGTFSTTFYHQGLNNNIIVSSDGTGPFTQNSRPEAVKPDLKSTGETRLILEFNPSLEMSISVLGKPKPEEVRADAGHIFRAVTVNDLSCRSGSHIQLTAEAALFAQIGNFKSPVTTISQKTLLDQCIEVPPL